MNDTKLLISKIKLMRNFEAEFEFYRIKGIFNKAIDVPKIVKTFQEEYDDNFKFEGTPLQLYKAIAKWIDKNVD